MNKILREHPEAVLVSLAVFFVVLVGGYLYLTIDTVIPDVDRAIATPSVTAPAGFDLTSAKAIDFKGLVNVSGTSVTAIAPVPVITPATTPSHTGTKASSPASSVSTPASTTAVTAPPATATTTTTTTAIAPPATTPTETTTVSSASTASTSTGSASTSTGQ